MAATGDAGERAPSWCVDSPRALARIPHPAPARAGVCGQEITRAVRAGDELRVASRPTCRPAGPGGRRGSCQVSRYHGHGEGADDRCRVDAAPQLAEWAVAGHPASAAVRAFSARSCLSVSSPRVLPASGRDAGRRRACRAQQVVVDRRPVLLTLLALPRQQAIRGPAGHGDNIRGPPAFCGFRREPGRRVRRQSGHPTDSHAILIRVHKAA
jgi:hypothetical protein